MKKTNNKGFSLVELIVVIAIMAVLMVIIAPQFLRYVDKTRQQKDDSAVNELQHAVEIAIADETIYNALFPGTATTATVTAADATDFATTITALQNELYLVFPEKQFDYTSAARQGKTYTITITKSASSGATVSGAWN